MLRRRSFLVATPATILAAPAIAQTVAPRANTRNIADTLAALGGYNQFLGLAQRAGAVEVLSGVGPFILLAPNDAALGRMPSTFMNGFAAQPSAGQQGGANPVQLRAFVNSHIIPNSANLAGVMGKTTRFTTLNGNVIVVQAQPGQPLRIEQTGTGGASAGGITIEPRDRVVEGGEVVASNGVIWPVSLPVVT
jgi:uncharacterized surface protein with fasciclin (FAS1) repeats